jgi:uncharacterized membrane protein/peptidoglycan hydrolase-like protein with peptidoglycan-binding domain
MLLDAWEGRHRSLAKAVSWRVAGSVDTLILSYLVTRSFVFATSIAGIETITKIVLYYLHERAWTIIPWGKRSKARMHFRLRNWIAATASAAAAMARLGHALHPSRLAAAGSLLFCLVIVVTPPHLRFGRPGIAESSPATSKEAISKQETAPATAGLHDHPAEPGVLDATHELADRAPGAAEPTRAADADPQATQQEAAAETPRRSVLEHDGARDVQQRLVQLGYLPVAATGMWGALSRKALKAFKSDHELPPDEVWDEATERSLFGGSPESLEPFVGVWGVDAGACSARLNRNGFLPAVIESEGAWAGETFCAFRNKKRTARGWEVVANCANAQDRWTANVRLTIVGEQLIWTSERGSQSYLRCQPGLGVARAF